MNRYAVAGRPAATAATANHVAAQLWNPATTISIYVYEIHWAQSGATVSLPVLQRSSARGNTPSATETPDADSDFEGGAAPPSGTVLELATFSTQPTLATPILLRWGTAAVAGPGWMWIFPKPIRVRPGTGLCIATPTATVLAAGDVTFVWEE